jgi:hypothetical protein
MVTICYAHCEGYVRFAARKYLEHVAFVSLASASLIASSFETIFCRGWRRPQWKTKRKSNVPVAGFAEKADFVDVLLLKRRNAVAHGEDTFVAIEDLDEVATQTVEIMRMFGDELENHVYLKDYRSADGGDAMQE